MNDLKGRNQARYAYLFIELLLPLHRRSGDAWAEFAFCCKQLSDPFYMSYTCSFYASTFFAVLALSLQHPSFIFHRSMIGGYIDIFLLTLSLALNYTLNTDVKRKCFSFTEMNFSLTIYNAIAAGGKKDKPLKEKTDLTSCHVFSDS